MSVERAKPIGADLGGQDSGSYIMYGMKFRVYYIGRNCMDGKSVGMALTCPLALTELAI